MNKDVVIKSLEDAIIETYCQFAVIEAKDHQSIVARNKEHYNWIDIDQTFENALDYFDSEAITNQLEYYCRFDSVIDHWQQTVLDVVDEDDLSEEEFEELYNSNGLKPLYKEAFANVMARLH